MIKSKKILKGRGSMNKIIITIVVAAFSSALMARVESGTILKETWTCKGEKNSYVSSLNVTVDAVKKTTKGTLVDGTMSSEAINLSLAKDRVHLEGGINGHDSRDYTVQLVANRSDDFYSSSFETKTVGQAVVVYGGFIDCVGDVGGAEVLSCEVALERAK
jgi:hypothetical protein